MWNWELPDWPNYSFHINELEKYEKALLKGLGAFSAVFRHLSPDEQSLMQVQLLAEEAEITSLIEGEVLNRDSLQASLRREMGLEAPRFHATPAEQGIAKVMLDAYTSYASPLTHETLLTWHRYLTQGRNDLEYVGEYRAFNEPMLIVSEHKYEREIHFEAPPSKLVPSLMTAFLQWFNDSSPAGKHPLPPTIRAGIAHLYFETIHPFEDGNGRIGRAIACKAVSQSLDEAVLIALSSVIESNKKKYYQALKTTNHSLDIQYWLDYFSHTLIQAQSHTQRHIEFILSKTTFFDQFGDRINERQRKVLLRMFKVGPDGFEGGLSADNYMSITKASRATATRDLQQLVSMQALIKKGELRYTRYYLNNKFSHQNQH